MTAPKNTWGGKRSGAGRPQGSTRKPPTVVKRIPINRLSAVETLLSQRSYRSAELSGWQMPVSSPARLARPLFASVVAAGFPSPADDYIEGPLDLNDYFIEHPAATFYVRVTGESMTGAGIFPGDILIVDRAVEPRHNRIVIAAVDNELTVKRLYRKGGRIELHPENPAFPVIRCGDERELQVWGVVTGVTRKL